MFIPPGYAQLTFVLEQETTGQQAMTSIGLQIEALDPATFFESVIDLWDLTFGEIVSDTWEGENVLLTVGTSDPSAPIVYSSGAWSGGGNGTDPAPPQVATLYRKITTQGGRKGRGRMYLVGPGESGIDAAGRFSESQHEDNLERGINFLEGLRTTTPGVAEVVLLHTDSDDDPTVIDFLVAQRTVATQRRRLR